MRLVAADAQGEQDSGDQQSGVGAPDPSEPVPSKSGLAAGVAEPVAGHDKGSGEKRGGDGVADERKTGNEEADGGAETATASEEAGKEGQDLEEEGDDDEDPAEPPHEEELERSGAAAVAAAETIRNILGTRVPCPTKGHGGLGAGAVEVVVAANVEVGPLGPSFCAGYALGVGA